jgi:Holliday junction DNA helicase RuvA
MITFLRGTVFSLGENYLDVDVNGVGYRVFVTDSYAATFMSNESVFVYTYQHVREDAIVLYGFPTEIDRSWFELLLAVSGIGPRSAMQILSGVSFSDFVNAIDREDVNLLCKLPGVGKKTAQRMLVELKDKIAPYQLLENVQSVRDSHQVTQHLSAIQRDVVEALMSLGYNEKQCIQQVQRIFSDEETPTLESALRSALQSLGK